MEATFPSSRNGSACVFLHHSAPQHHAPSNLWHSAIPEVGYRCDPPSSVVASGVIVGGSRFQLTSSPGIHLRPTRSPLSSSKGGISHPRGRASDRCSRPRPAALSLAQSDKWPCFRPVPLLRIAPRSVRPGATGLAMRAPRPASSLSTAHASARACRGLRAARRALSRPRPS